MGTAPPSSSTVQPLSLTNQETKAPTASGNDSSMRQLTTLPKSPYGLGTGSAIKVGRPVVSGLDASSETYPAWLPAVSAAIAGAKARLTKDWMEGGERKLVLRC